MKATKLQDYVNDQHRGQMYEAAKALNTSHVTVYNRINTGVVIDGVIYVPLQGKSILKGTPK